MTSKSRTESNRPAVAGPIERISYLSGHWIPHDQMRLAVDDVGFRQGVTAVERLRSYSGHLFAVDAHLDRWQQTTDHLGIGGLPSRAETKSLLQQLITHNSSTVQAEGDVGMTMFATPGVPGGELPTFGLHLNPLDHERIAMQRTQGQPLVVTDVRQPDPQCWPRSIKVRCRIHYHLADRIARRQNEDAVGVLLDTDASITETSIANLAIVRAGQIFSPPSVRVLPGITQSIIESLAGEAGIAWSKRPIWVTDFSQAGEILMMGTNGGIWFANSIDGSPIGEEMPGDLFLLLRERFDKYIERSISP